MAEERLEEIRQARLAKRQALIDAGREPYPAEARRTHTTDEVVEQFDQLVADKTPVVMIGRLMALRSHGAVAFGDLADAYDRFQIQFTRDHLPDDVFERLKLLDVGDFVQATGQLTTTERGVKTLMLEDWHIVSKSIRPLPSSWYGLKDQEKRYRNREIDLLLNDDATRALKIRGQVISWLRYHLAQDGYMEFETPILQTVVGGAAARPFMTHYNALDADFGLRIAAELYLKRLLTGGYEKVFEIGRRFRNEGIDRQHNPEFTMLESQWAYADYEDYMTFTEEKLDEMFTELLGTTEIRWQDQDLSFAKPFKRERYVDLVSAKLGVDILDDKEPKTYLDLLKKHELDVPESKTYMSLVDELFKELIRPKLVQPTLLYDFPYEMVPLAKRSTSDRRVVEMFQLVVAGTELVKAYTELNDPVEQLAAFEQQRAEREAGNREAHDFDRAYLRAMEYGMPPNAGWGIGIDRLVMIMADVPSIRDVIAFPQLRPEAE